MVAAMQTCGFSDAQNPCNVHSSANSQALYVGPHIAQTATAYIEQLQALQKHGTVDQVSVARKTVDGRSVINMGECSNPTNMLTKGVPFFFLELWGWSR